MTKIMFKNKYEAIQVSSNAYKIMEITETGTMPARLFQRLYSKEQLGRMGFILKKVS